jgi:nucleotide-binding universal stress UspA family protein
VQKYDAKLLLLQVLPKAVEEVSTNPSGPIVAPYAGTITLTGPQDLRPSGPLAAPYPSSEGMAQHGSSRQSEVVLIEYVEKAEAALNDLARSQLAAPVPAKARVAVGKPAEEILQMAGDEGVDLIVMGTHGRTGLRHILLGSVAETVVRTAPCPVFTVKAPAQSAS